MCKIFGDAKKRELSSVKRHLNLIILSFLGTDGTELAVHIQCFMRFIQGGEVIVTTNDIYRQANSQIDFDDFDWTIPFSSRFDKVSEQFITSNKLIVNSMERVNNDLFIKLNSDITIEIFSDVRENENYRIFIVGEDDHYEF
jgi:hypothetical protein